MADERGQAKEEMRRETESFTAGPGLVASKSQARGGLAGTLAGGVGGALVGLVVGLLAYSETGRAIVISVVSFAVAGATFGAVVGGFLKPRQKRDPTEGDT